MPYLCCSVYLRSNSQCKIMRYGTYFPEMCIRDSLKFVGSRLSHFFGRFDFDDIQVQHFDLSLLLISVWILFLPVPRVAAHINEIFFRLPAEHFQTFCGICIAGRKVSGAARDDLIRHLDAVCLLKGVNHVKHAVAAVSYTHLRWSSRILRIAVPFLAHPLDVISVAGYVLFKLHESILKNTSHPLSIFRGPLHQIFFKFSIISAV